ncbi:hypothetical protein ASF78_04895 [Cellulomonas sp. Leaf334]|nr:hypothetical protein ASF78_04895 [Cellulomonas sp. Leaf334]
MMTRLASRGLRRKRARMFQYDTTIDPAADNTSHGLLLSLVGADRRVLDLGCATGYLAEALGANGCTVSGVEYVPEAAEKARPFLEKLVVADLNDFDLVAEFGAGTFDVLVFGDVLEHLLDPVSVLRSAVPLLAPGGSVVISIPNVAHGSLRLALLQGRWRYTDTGLLDRTHIRFFTRRSLLELLASAGLAPVDVRRTTADPLGVEVQIDAAELPAGVVEWLAGQPDADTYQFVVRAVVDDAESAVTQLAHRAADAEERLQRAERERDTEREARLAAEHDVETLRSTAGFRALTVPRRWYAAARRATSRGRA